MTTTNTNRRQGVNSSKAIKVPVHATTGTTITLSGEQTIDGVSCTEGMRVLVRGQTDAKTNGIYDVSTGAWTRSLDFDGDFDITRGTLVHVLDGGVNDNTWWELTTDSPVIGTSNLTFSQTFVGDSDVLEFLQSGTGAVVRDAQSKMREWVTPLDFGAPADGVSNDRTAFAAAEATGRLVYVPGYDYALGSDVTTSTGAWLLDPTANFAIGFDKLKMERGFWTNTEASANGANIWRFRDRIFLGDACDSNGKSAGVHGYGSTTWLANGETPTLSWLDRESQLMVLQSVGSIAITGVSRSQDKASLAYGIDAIGGAFVGQNDYSATADTTSAWAMYLEGRQYRSIGSAWGIECAVLNLSGSDPGAGTPYTMGVQGQAVGISLQNHGGLTNPVPGNAVCAIHVGASISRVTWPGRFHAGIIFDRGAFVNGGDVAGNSPAIMLAKGHDIDWHTSASNVGGRIRCSATAIGTMIEFENATVSVSDLDNSKTIAQFTALSTSAVNYPILYSNVTGSPARVSVGGDDTNIDLWLSPKGNGRVRIGTFRAFTAGLVTGYIEIRDAGGTTRYVACLGNIGELSSTGASTATVVGAALGAMAAYSAGVADARLVGTTA